MRLCSRRFSLLLVLDCTQARDILHVLIVGLSEGVSAGAVGHEIELLRTRRIGGGLDRGATGIGNRPGRQAVDDIRVIGRGLGNLALGQRVAERAFAEDETIDDGRVRLQLHLLLEPIRQHRRYARALLGLAGLFLDNGRENNELLGRLDRQIGIASVPDFPHQPLLHLAHALVHLLAREAAMEMVAVGQKAALLGNVLDVAGEDVVLEQPRDDLLGRQALGNRDLVLHHLAVDDRLHHILDARVLGEKIFASLEVRARLEREHTADEDERMRVHHPFALKQIRDLHHAGARRDDDNLVLL